MTERNVKKYVDVIFDEVCKQQKLEMESDFSMLAAKQASVMESRTVHLGDEFFATSVGEVWKKYACRPTVVKARPSKLCFTSLPVSLMPSDEALFKKRLNPTEGAKKKLHERSEKEEAPEKAENTEMQENWNRTSDFFLEPDTHRITRVTDQIPCDEFFSPLYKSDDGTHVEIISGGFRPYAERIFQDSPMFNHTSSFEWEKIDWNNVGVYTPAQIASMETAQNHRALLTQLTKQTIIDNSFDGTNAQRHLAYRVDAAGFIRGYGDGIYLSPFKAVSDTWEWYLHIVLNILGIYVLLIVFWKILKIAMDIRADLLIGATPGKAIRSRWREEFSSVNNFLEARRVRQYRKRVALAAQAEALNEQLKAFNLVRAADLIVLELKIINVLLVCRWKKRGRSLRRGRRNLRRCAATRKILPRSPSYSS